MNEIQKMPDSEGKKISEFDRKQQNEVQALNVQKYIHNYRLN